nr:FtsH protease activity modulator HflK [uncultured Sphingomonas sp.]
MSFLSAWAARGRALFNDSKGPWGAPPPEKGSNGGPKPDPKPGPWGGGDPDRSPRGPATSLDEILKRSRDRFGGGGRGGGGGSFGRLGGPDGSTIGWAALGAIALVLLFTSFHSIAPQERGVVTRFGRYNSTLTPGVGFTLPWPIERVQKVDVDKNREINVGTGGDDAQTLMLTGDQNIIDIAYMVRWKIKNPEQYLFELKEPEKTVQQVAESAMRQVIANVSLQGAMGNQRGEIEARVAEEMQRTLDDYDSGVQILGISLRQADPPAEVNDAFKEVTAAQQDAQTDINNANAYSLQLKQISQGEATAFDKVYEQYRLAPGVTRRRMYYETMERVLQNVDKTIVESDKVTPYLPLNQVTPDKPKETAK